MRMLEKGRLPLLALGVAALAGTSALAIEHGAKSEKFAKEITSR